MKTALVTGSSSGIGKETVQQLLDQGWQVIGVSRTIDRDVENPRFISFELDLSVHQKFDTIREYLEEHKISLDLLVHSAGVGGGTPLITLSEDEFDRIMNTNLKGVVFFTQALLPFLSEHSTVCFLSSIAGIQGFSEWSVYCASKFAIEGFAASLRHELRSRHIRVSVIRPGSVDTPFYADIPASEKIHFMPPKTISRCIVELAELPATATYETVFINNSVGDL